MIYDVKKVLIESIHILSIINYLVKMNRGGNYMPKNNDTGYSGRNQNQNQQTKNMQKIIQDQNYSN